jgi:hypothetical protein
MYPLDVVKTRMQLASGATAAGAPKSVFATLRHIAQTEGTANLYRGIISPILAEAPKRACKFASNEQYKKLVARADGSHTALRLYIAGAMAGATEAFVNTPFEVVKVRMQSKENLAVCRCLLYYLISCHVMRCCISVGIDGRGGVGGVVVGGVGMVEIQRNQPCLDDHHQGREPACVVQGLRDTAGAQCAVERRLLCSDRQTQGCMF